MNRELEILRTLRTLVDKVNALEQRLAVEQNKLVDINGAAEVLGKTKWAVRGMVRDGKLNVIHAPNGRLRFEMAHLISVRDARR